MRFQILHRSPGRLRLRACVSPMEPEQADLLEAWLLTQPEVDRVSVQEGICSVTVIYHGPVEPVTARLAAFTYERAAAELPPLHHSLSLIHI